MTRNEFAPIMAYLATATGAPTPTREQSEVYFDLLGDLDARTVQAAAKQVVLNHVYPNLPPVGVIRKAAVAMRSPAIPGPKAWELFLFAVRRHGSGKRTVRAEGKWHQISNETIGMKTLPEQVARAARAFGWDTLCNTGDGDLGIAQTQFLKVYATLADHEQHAAIMPPAVKNVAAILTAEFGRPMLAERN